MNGLQCSYPGTDGQSTRCSCSDGRWYCDSCQFQGGFPPTSDYACNRSCRLDTYEWDHHLHLLSQRDRQVLR